jgi:hypothetical protein
MIQGNRKHQGLQSKNSNSSNDSKMPKIIKSSSYTEKTKFETLHNPIKRSPSVIKIHEDSDNNKSKSSSKVLFWVSPDMSPGIENLFCALDLNDRSSSLIISMNLFNIKNMVQLFNLDLEDGRNLFSRKYLH